MNDVGAFLRAVPTDLLLAALAVPVGLLALLPGVNGSALQAVIAMPLVLFAPGYTVVAALLPARRSRPTEVGLGHTRQPGVGERLGLSALANALVLTLTCIALIGAGLRLDLASISAALAAVTLIAAAIAVRRRLALPEELRMVIGVGDRLRGLVPERPTSRVETGLYVLVAVGVVFALSTAAYGMSAPDTADSYTAFYLANQNGSADVMADYPTSFTVGEGHSLVFGVENHEGRTVSYTVVLELQRVAYRGDQANVVERQEIGRYGHRVGPGETWRRAHTVAPSMTGDHLRLTYLLYEGDVPATPTIENADRSLHLWISVTPANPTPSTR